MEFDKSKVYTALNADESLIGAKGYFAESLCGLIRLVKSDYLPEHKVQRIKYDCIIADDCDVKFNFFYPVEPAPEKWYVTHTSYDDKLNITEKGLVGDIMFTGTKKECEQWIAEHSKPKYRPFKDSNELIKTYKSKLNGHYDVAECQLDLPTIWVKHKIRNSKRTLQFDIEYVLICEKDGNHYLNMRELFENFTFLDGSVCGVEE